MALVLKSLTNLAHASARTSFLQATLLSSMLSPRRMSSVLSDDGRSRIQLGASDAEVEELIESNLVHYQLLLTTVCWALLLDTHHNRTRATGKRRTRPRCKCSPRAAKPLRCACCALMPLPTCTPLYARYRDIWRNSLLFVWKDEKGRVWCVVGCGVATVSRCAPGGTC